MSIKVVAAAVSLVLLGICPGCDRRIDVDLAYALDQGDLEWAARLLDEGADIDAQLVLEDGYTPLMLVASADCEPEALQLLLDRGADPDVPAFSGRTALHVAADEGCALHVRMLLAAGASVNIRSQVGKTPLQEAHEDVHTVVERLIREAGGTY